MTAPVRAVLAWGLGTLAILTSVVGDALLATAPSSPDPGAAWPLQIVLLLVMILPGIGFPLVGALVASRQPSNAIAWIFLAIGLGWALQLLALGVRESTLLVSGAEADLLFAWIGSWAWMIAASLGFVFIPLLYPAGRLLSRRWRPFAVAAGVVLALQVLASAFAPGPLGADVDLDNPVGVRGIAGDLLQLLSPSGFGMLLFAAVTMGAVASLVMRFRRSRALERQQIKWLAYVAGVTAAVFLVEAVLIVGQPAPIVSVPTIVSDLLFALVLAGFGSLPLAAGVAILRYRLYDIDLLINRTLVYGALTLGLGTAYVGLVIVLQGLLSGFTGGNSLAVAASTLAVAALFQPLRRRIQQAVDRRFYRSRYDAGRTLDAFSARLRHEVDLARLTDELRGVVTDTLRPASVSVWLRRR